MTPAERLELWDAINDVVVASGGNPSNTSVARQKAVVRVERSIGKLLALAEAVPARLAMSHHAHCRKVTEMLGGQRRRVACTCGHDALAAAWAALGGG